MATFSERADGECEGPGSSLTVAIGEASGEAHFYFLFFQNLPECWAGALPGAAEAHHLPQQLVSLLRFLQGAHDYTGYDYMGHNFSGHNCVSFQVSKATQTIAMQAIPMQAMAI